MPTKLIAFHLPQFHPIRENNEWWGPGFTEWHNVAKARPLYRGHNQPKLPGELGFYDLRLTETLKDQANLARTHGIYGFCYWHYWFAGHRLLEQPLENLLEAKHVDFPFCLGWANETWTGVWHGEPKKTLIAQNYPPGDAEKHYRLLRRFFHDSRYIRHEGKPLLYIYRPRNLSEADSYLAKLREYALADGFPGLYILGTWSPNPGGRFDDANALQLDGAVTTNITGRDSKNIKSHYWEAISARIRGKLGSMTGPQRIDYEHAAKFMLPDLSQFSFPAYHTVVSNWDNTPRSGRRGLVLTGGAPEKFGKVLSRALEASNHLIGACGADRYIFVKSWNEWAEGNYIEPSFNEGRGYLEVILEALNKAK